MNKATNWSGQDLVGTWLLTLKVDGVRALRASPEAPVLSRAGKPLHNLDHIPFLDAEVFFKSWEQSVSMVRTIDGDPVPAECVYSLDPLDDRLVMLQLTDPSAAEINAALASALARGYEGLVMRGPDRWLKVKPTETHDVEVLEVIPGKGKHTGRMGALMTPMGKVGTGFTDAERAQPPAVGAIIEVECMGLTPNGMFRHPRFKRERFDK